MGLFPTYIEETLVTERPKENKIPKEYGINFATGQLTGKIVEGAEAVKVWVWFALQTPRYRYYVYSWDYGNDFETLIGQGYSKEYIDSEVRRMTEECLLVNKHIKSITNFSVDMEKNVLTVSFTIDTIYGEIRFENERIMEV